MIVSSTVEIEVVVRPGDRLDGATLRVRAGLFDRNGLHLGDALDFETGDIHVKPPMATPEQADLFMPDAREDK